MRLTEEEFSRIAKVDIPGSKSVIEALRSGIGEAEDVLIEAVQKARTLSTVRNEADAALRSKFGMEDHA